MTIHIKTSIVSDEIDKKDLFNLLTSLNHKQLKGLHYQLLNSKELTIYVEDNDLEHTTMRLIDSEDKSIAQAHFNRYFDGIEPLLTVDAVSRTAFLPWRNPPTSFVSLIQEEISQQLQKIENDQVRLFFQSQLSNRTMNHQRNKKALEKSSETDLMTLYNNILSYIAAKEPQSFIADILKNITIPTVLAQKELTPKEISQRPHVTFEFSVQSTAHDTYGCGEQQASNVRKDIKLILENIEIFLKIAIDSIQQFRYNPTGEITSFLITLDGLTVTHQPEVIRSFLSDISIALYASGVANYYLLTSITQISHIPKEEKKITISVFESKQSDDGCLSYRVRPEYLAFVSNSEQYLGDMVNGRVIQANLIGTPNLNASDTFIFQGDIETLKTDNPRYEENLYYHLGKFLINNPDVKKACIEGNALVTIHKDRLGKLSYSTQVRLDIPENTQSELMKMYH